MPMPKMGEKGEVALPPGRLVKTLVDLDFVLFDKHAKVLESWGNLENKVCVSILNTCFVCL